MNEPKQLPVPLHLIMLDAVGAMLVGLGLAEHYAAVDLWPAAFAFEHRAFVLIGIGAVLMLPIIFHLLNRIRSQSEGKVLK